MAAVRIESLANGGDGVGRDSDGRTVFVRGAAPGDLVEIAIREDHGSWTVADIVSVVDPSPDRVTPPCPYFSACGGCQWQHISALAQRSAKTRIVEDALRRIGRLDVTEGLVASCVPAPEEYGYRNKVELVATSAEGKFALGYHRVASSEVVPIDRCLLLPSRFVDLPLRLSGALRYLSGSRDLGIERAAIRASRDGRDLEIALWTAPSAFPRDVVGSTVVTATGATSVVRVLSRRQDPARPTKVEVLAGRGAWREQLAGTDYLVSAPSFFQVNTRQAETLIELVGHALDPDGSDRVVDVYSGVGTFTLPLARKAGEVTAVESSGPAIRDLRRNLELSRLEATVEPGDAARALPQLGAFDLAVVDPPRSGLSSAALRALASTHARAIAYVSCDPATLARDARKLVDAGYALASVIPVDMFPQTYHVETVSHFVRTQGL